MSLMGELHAHVGKGAAGVKNSRPRGLCRGLPPGQSAWASRYSFLPYGLERETRNGSQDGFIAVFASLFAPLSIVVAMTVAESNGTIGHLILGARVKPMALSLGANGARGMGCVIKRSGIYAIARGPANTRANPDYSSDQLTVSLWCRTRIFAQLLHLYRPFPVEGR